MLSNVEVFTIIVIVSVLAYEFTILFISRKNVECVKCSSPLKRTTRYPDKKEKKLHEGIQIVADYTCTKCPHKFTIY